MTSAKQWCAVFLVLVIAGLIASLVFLMLSKNRRKWVYWAGSFVGFVVVGFVILMIIYPEKSKSESEIYKNIVQQAKNNPICTTEREVCIRREMDAKRENDLLLRSDLPELEQKLVRDPKNKNLIEIIKFKKDSLANDIRKLDNCKFEKASNPCINHMLNICENMIREKNDPVLYQQFQDFRTTKDPSEVLNLCNSVATIS